jgi:signal transduction histidine kinase
MSAGRIPAEARAELLDPEAWRDTLAGFARAMRLAVVLVDTDGRPLGEVHNPQPMWTLLRDPHAESGCAFCLGAQPSCGALERAVAGAEPAISHDCAGLAHAAVPLMVSGEVIGAVLAGQVFDAFPQNLLLDRVAHERGVSPQEVWQLARRQRLMPNLEACGKVLQVLVGSFAAARHAAIEERLRGAEMLALRQDVAERGRREEVLRETDRLKDEFIATLAHELRNPLATLCAATEVMNRTGPQDPNFAVVLGAVSRQSAQLRRLVDDLLDVARASHGKLALERKPVDLLELAQTIAAEYRARHGEAARFEAAGEPAWVEGDEARLRQIIDNLLDNAVKFGAANVSLRASVEGDRSRLVIGDDGEGMPPELIASLFQPFVQAQQSIDRPRGGLGLGLALASRLAALHGGSLEARSAGAGQGSELELVLPRIAAPQAGAGPERFVNATGSARRIVVIDDDQDARESLIMLLKVHGHSVSGAGDGLRGCEEVAARRPDVVLVDLGLPGIDGYEVARRVRSLPDLISIKLVAVSGYGRPQDKLQSRAAGFDLHLVKPIEYSQLAPALDG